MSTDPESGQAADPQAIAERYLELLQAGKAPSREEFLRAHPDASGALAKRLALLQVMHRAALGSTLGSHVRSAHEDQAELKVRCPHCGQVAQPGSHSRRSPAAGDPGQTPKSGELVCAACERSFLIELGAPPDGKAGELPAEIGKFRILSLLGRGSFGAVYKAQDPELGRLVAIKMPRASQLFSPEEEERFLREARSAALLHHRGIVQVYEVAEERGIPYIVSEYIEGRNLAERIAAGTPAYRETAEMTARIAEALHFAHQARIVHRDIKPGNLLLDAAGRPHIADFGLARHDEDKVTVTLEGQVIGTPAYMSPEQAAGDPRNVDARSDIYSLGVVLYELLSGERPFRGSRTQLLHQVLHEEPRPPCALNDRIPRDLETICLKAMAKEPGRRYGTAADMAADLRRFLEGRPILARPVSRPERLWRWSRRNPAVASLLGAVAVLLVAIAAVASAMAFRTARARDEANQRLARLHVATGFRLAAAGDFLGSLPWFTEAHQLDEGRPARDALHRLRFESSLGHCPKLLRVWSHEHLDNNSILAWFHPGGERILVVSAGRASIVSAAEEGREELQLPAPEVTSGDFSPDGRLAVTCSKDGAVRLWDAATGAAHGQPLRHQRRVQNAAFAGDGRLLVTSSDDRTARIWRPDSGEAVGPPLLHDAEVWFACFDPTGARVVTACAGGYASVWDVSSGNPIGERMGHEQRVVYRAVFSPDGRKVATASYDETARVWDAATGRALVAPLRHGNLVVVVNFRHDGLRLLTAGYDGAAIVWDAGTGEKLVTIAHGLGVPTAAFSPDGQRILTASFEGTAGVWDAATGTAVSPPLHNGGTLHGAWFSPEGRRVLTASSDDTLRLWDLAAGGSRPVPLRVPGGVAHASFSPDGAHVLVATSAGIGQLWTAKNGEAAGPPLSHASRITQASFSPHGRLVVTACADGTVRLWDSHTARAVGDPLVHPGSVFRAVFSPDALRLVTVVQDLVRVWEVGSGKESGSPLRHRTLVNDVSWAPDGRRILTACGDGDAWIWDLEKAEIVVGPLHHAKLLLQGSFSPDGTRVATISQGPEGRLWDASTGAPVPAPLRHEMTINSIEFSHDGRRVVTASFDATARVWDARTGMPITPPLRHRGVVAHAAFSPDDALVVTASNDRTAIVWDAETGEQVTPPFLHRAGVSRALFSPDVKQLLTAGADGVARLWSLPSGRRPVDDEALLSHMLSGRRIDSTGGFVRIPTPDFEDAWRRLRRQYAADFTPSPEDVGAWHENEATDCEAARNWTWVVRHLTEVLKTRPGDAYQLLRRARAHGWLGQLAESAADYAAAIALGASEAQIFYLEALTRLVSGDRDGFRRSSQALFTRFREAGDARSANELAWSCSIVPGVCQDMTVPLAAAEKAVAAAPRSHNYRNTLGAVLYRAGDFARARKELEESVNIHGAGGNVYDWLFLAMVHERLGNATLAATFLDQARSWAARLAEQSIEKPLMSHWCDPLQVRILLAEAEALAAGR